MSYKYVVVGGGNASGYAAKEFVSQNVAPGELCIITAEPYVAYERPALSKAYLFPEGAARLPGFHTCVGGGGDRQTPEWYVEKGIEYKLNTKVTEIDVTKKTVTTESGDSIAYENLIFATGCRPMTMADFKTPGAELPGLYYLRDVVDADRLIEGIKAAKEKGGKAVVVGGGYIGMEVAAALQMHGLNVTMVFPEEWFMMRLFTKDLASFYEDYYQKKGISIMKGVLASGFEAGPDGQVGKVLLNNGQSLDVDGLVVVGTGARPNSELVGKQVELEAGAVKVDTKLRASVPNLWAIGDVAAFPLVKYGGRLQRQEHVTNCRQTAAHAVRDIMNPENTADYNYLPFFYSRVFDLSWVFYGVNEGDIVTFGDKAEKKFGCYWVKDGKVMGAFLEGGKPEEVASLKKVAEQQPAAPADLAAQGLAFAASI